MPLQTNMLHMTPKSLVASDAGAYICDSCSYTTCVGVRNERVEPFSIHLPPGFHVATKENSMGQSVQSQVQRPV